MTLATLTVLAAMTSAEAIATLLNSKDAVMAEKYAEAREIVEREAAEGKPLQQFVVAVTVADNRLTMAYAEASRGVIEEMAKKQNNALAWYLLSMEKNDFGALRKAANRGNVHALNAQGTICTQEALTRKNLSEVGKAKLLARSFACFREAADLGDPNGFINLGTCYLNGYGCSPNKELAFLYYKVAARAGHPEGMDNIAGCYRYGDGVEKNDELSLEWAMRGRAARGDEAAAKWLEERK